MNINYSKLNSLRNIARKIGLVRLLSFPGQVKRSLRKREYERNKPATATIGFDSITTRLHTETLYEWMRVQSFHDDRQIIGAIVGHLKKGDACWDIGASIGLYSTLFAKAVGTNGEVVSFEPENRSREKLMANIALNEMTQIKVFPVALGREKGRFDLMLAPNASAGTHRLAISGDTEESADMQSVEVWQGDEFLSAHNLLVPNAIKIDVEGQEENVLLGLKNILSNPACKTVVCEIHFSILSARGDDEAPARIMQLLQSCGFGRQTWIDASHLAAYKGV